jgi:hypothetical protein
MLSSLSVKKRGLPSALFVSNLDNTPQSARSAKKNRIIIYHRDRVVSIHNNGKETTCDTSLAVFPLTREHSGSCQMSGRCTDAKR